MDNITLIKKFICSVVDTYPDILTMLTHSDLFNVYKNTMHKEQEMNIELGPEIENTIEITVNYESLQLALDSLDLKMIKLLVPTMTLDTLRYDDNYALYSSASDGDLKIFKYLLKQGLISEDIKSNNNRILKTLVKNNNYKFLSYLISKGYLDANDIEESGAIDIAVKNKNNKIIDLLSNI